VRVGLAGVTEVLVCGKDLDPPVKADRDASKNFEAAKWEM
jgi:hypothetical protein